MQFALNYSFAAADLLREGKIQIERFKCPAWPDLVTSVQGLHPVYVHFPLRAGAGIGDAIDNDTKQPADWHKVERLMLQTGTPQVNLHLEAFVDDYPDIPADTSDPTHVDRVAQNLIRDVWAVIERFGPERVVVENDHSALGHNLRPAYLPEVIERVVEETGCGLLLDVSHARLAAHTLGMDVRDYIGQLPARRIREMHITGLQRFEGRWVQMARRAGIDGETIQRFAGQLLDHLPITDDGWQAYAWAMDQVHRPAWGQPWVVTFEYGGIGGVWEMVTDRAVLAEQVPRLRRLVTDPRSTGDAGQAKWRHS
jgi:uncharacterized protein (UPF0276 family)